MLIRKYGKVVLVLAAILILSTGLFFSGGCGNNDATVEEKKEEETSEAYSFNLTNLEGEEVSMEDDLLGKVVFIKFWGMDCPYCVVELPEIDRLTNEYQDDEEVEILTINFTDAPGEIEELLDDDDLDIEVLLDEEEEAAAGFGVFALPTYFIVNAEGEIELYQEGSLGYEEAVDFIEDIR